MDSLIKKLDLDDYIKSFKHFFAREKSIILEGDSKRHFNFIQALSKIEFKAPPEVANLDDILARLKKHSTLRVDEIYSFVKIMEYFNYLKATEAPTILKEWFAQIEIPEAMREIIGFFDERGEINLQNYPELFELEEAIKRNRADIKESLQRILHSSKMAQFAVDTQIHFYDGQESLLVRGGFLQVLDASIIGRSEGGFFYIIPKSIEKLKSKEEAIEAKRESIIWEYRKRFSEIFHKWVRFLEFINREFDRFDHYQARVNFAKALDYEFVLPSNTKEIILDSFAHPAISKPVPITIELKKPIMLITGVNAGGKTMLLKSLLSAVFFSKYLLPFRCNSSKSRVGNFKNIQAIIDDPQSVKNDISTFAGRMVEFSRLFRERDSIVGVDEIELGTDADEAASLFRVLLEELKRRDITFIVTTHHKRLASLMAGDRDVELIAALYDEKSQSPTYTFLQGSIGKSYAFETARRYGIPVPVVERAREFFGEDKEKLNELIEKSTILEAKMREKIEELESKIAKLDKKERSIDELKENLKESHKKLSFELEKSYQEAKSKALEALKEVEVAKARQLLNEAHRVKNSSSSKSKPEESSKNFRVGDKIRYRGKSGTILSLRKKEATILVDGMKLRVLASELDFDKSKKIIKPKNNINVSVEKSNRGSLSLKILGKRVDEAIDEIDNFLSNALLQGFNEIEIIHGIGTGALAKAVSEYLKNHPKVKSFAKMKGNMGITVVNL